MDRPNELAPKRTQRFVTSGGHYARSWGAGHEAAQQQQQPRLRQARDEEFSTHDAQCRRAGSA